MIRPFRPEDTPTLVALFQNTVRNVNKRDYTPEQIAAWAPDDIDPANWVPRFLNSHALVATDGATITGFANIERDGYLDMLFVHSGYQGKGVATALVAELEKHARAQKMKAIYAHVSITARPFFAKRGYRMARKMRPWYKKLLFTNHIMEKRLDALAVPPRATLVLVTGPAASGKTALSYILARELRLPLFTKDQFKEPQYDAFGAPERIEQHRTMGKLAHDVLNSVSAELIRAGVSHILEAPFSEEEFTPYLRALLKDHDFRVVQVELRCDGETLLKRFVGREEGGRAHPGHQGIRYLDTIRERLLKGRVTPLTIEGPRLEVDTTDFSKVDNQAIVAFVREAISANPNPR